MGFNTIEINLVEISISITNIYGLGAQLFVLVIGIVQGIFRPFGNMFSCHMHPESEKHQELRNQVPDEGFECEEVLA